MVPVITSHNHHNGNHGGDCMTKVYDGLKSSFAVTSFMSPRRLSTILFFSDMKQASKDGYFIPMKIKMGYLYFKSKLQSMCAIVLPSDLAQI